MEQNSPSWNDILRLAEANIGFATAIGVVVGLYIVGRFEERREEKSGFSPTFNNQDEEIAYHKKRIAYLELLKAADKPIEEIVTELMETVQKLQDEIADLKGRTS